MAGAWDIFFMPNYLVGVEVGLFSSIFLETTLGVWKVLPRFDLEVSPNFLAPPIRRYGVDSPAIFAPLLKLGVAHINFLLSSAVIV